MGRLADGQAPHAMLAHIKEAVRPRTWLVFQVADFAYAACGPQIFILRVSGIKYRLSTKHTAGTAIG